MNGGDLAGLKGSLVSLGVSWLFGRGNWFGGSRVLIDAQEEAQVGGKIGIGSTVKEGKRLLRRYDDQQLCPIMPVMSVVPIISNSFLERRKRQLLNVWSGTK